MTRRDRSLLGQLRPPEAAPVLRILLEKRQTDLRTEAETIAQTVIGKMSACAPSPSHGPGILPVARPAPLLSGRKKNNGPIEG